jgi:hypothetical protein
VVNIAAIIAFLLGLAGLVTSSQATFGASLVAFACLWALLVRISQADTHHKALLARFKSVPL